MTTTTPSKNNMSSFILLFTQSKEMPRKTLKRSRKSRRRTIRRVRKHKGGADSQALIIPTKAIEVSAGGINSQDQIYGIAKL
jgi:hypothetical protein